MSFDKSLYYNLNKVKSYNRLINMIISNRGVGKTYAMKKEVITNFIKTGKQFIYIRRTSDQLKKIKDPDEEGGRFFTDIQDDFPDHLLDIVGDKFYCNGEVMGYMIPLTRPGALRGSSLHNITVIWFDEFISIGSPDDRYLSDEFNNFLNVCDTIIRNRTDVRIYMLANPYSLVNPYFRGFGLDVKAGERITAYKNILIDFYMADDFAEARKKTAFGEVIANTSYGSFSLDNQSVIDSDAYIKERARSSQFLFNMLYKNSLMSVFYDEYTGLYYVSEGINPEYKGTVVFADVDITEETEYVKHFRDSRKMFMMKMAFDEGLIYYDDLNIKDLCFSVYKRCGILK